jgi:hypothetical protein
MSTSLWHHLYLTIVDMLLLLLAFAAVQIYKYGNLFFRPREFFLLQILMAVWLVVSLFYKKFTLLLNMPLFTGVGLLIRANITMIFFLTLAVVSLSLWQLSRLVVYGPCLVLLSMELAAFVLYHRFIPAPEHAVSSASKQPHSQISMALLVIDGGLLALAFLTTTWLKRGGLILEYPYVDVIIVVFCLWLFTSIVSGKFYPHNFITFYDAFGTAIKSIVMTAVGLAVILYGFRLGAVSRLQVFGSLFLFLILESLIFILYLPWRSGGRQLKDIEDAEEVRAMTKGDPSRELPPKPCCQVNDAVREKLEHALEFFNPDIFTFIDQNVDLQSINRCECTLLSTDNLFNLQSLEIEESELIINLHKINDIRWFNRYFLLAHTRLKPSGCIMGKAHTAATHRAWFASRFPSPFGSLVYSASFLWHWICPKLPYAKNFYFAVTKGRNRLVSQAEILGRLYFCGFEIVAETELDKNYYFIAKKVKTPSEDLNPTYGPLVKLNRHGLAGRPLVVYKFRTMYPYSEYLQKYIYTHNSLDAGGKFKNDFRVTEWGRFMRKFWLDELPMLYNWLTGDMQLLGVRPLSTQYLSLYSIELQRLRSKVKPGLIPPFYADMPKTMEEIMASEERYIMAYLKKPFFTQFRYFWLCFWNIVIKRARSG